MTSAAQKYFELYYRLNRYIYNGEGSSEKANKLLVEMDDCWCKMTEKERELLDIVGKKPITKI